MTSDTQRVRELSASECSTEILPLNAAETENVSGGGNVGNLYFYNRMRELTAGLTNPATETAIEVRGAFLGPSGPERPVLG